MIDLLASRGARSDLRTKFGTTPLHDACSKGNVAVSHQLVISVSPYLLLAEPRFWHFLQAVTALLSHGVSTEVRDNDGLSPLHTTCSAVGATSHRTGTHTIPSQAFPLICSRLATEIARLLISHGADVNSKDTGNSTPLHALAYCSAEDDDVVSCADLLLSSGLSYASENEIGWTPLHSASSSVLRTSLHSAVLDGLT